MNERFVQSMDGCRHPFIRTITDGRWCCDVCLRIFFPSGDTAIEQECVRLRDDNKVLMNALQRIEISTVAEDMVAIATAALETPARKALFG